MEAKRIIAITQALNTGCTLEHKGGRYTFTGLTLGDLAEILQRQKDKQLGSYLRVAMELKIARPERFRDMHDIQARCAREEDYNTIQNPDNLRFMAWLSLRHNHPKMTEEQAGELVSDEEFGDIVADILAIQTKAPINFDDGGGASPDPLVRTTTSPT